MSRLTTQYSLPVDTDGPLRRSLETTFSRIIDQVNVGTVIDNETITTATTIGKAVTLVDPSSTATIVATLAPAIDWEDRVMYIRNVAKSGVVNVVPQSGELLDGTATYGILPSRSLALISDGSGWHTVSSGNLPSVLNVREYGAKGDGVTDDTTAVNSAKANASYYVPAGTGTYLTTLTFNTTGAHHWGAGRVETTDGKRANEVINISAPPAVWDNGNGILDIFDGEFMSPKNQQISVTGALTVGNPALNEGYRQYDQTAGNMTSAYFAAGVNTSMHSNADRTGWAVFQSRLQHYGKADASVYWCSVFVNAKDPATAGGEAQWCQGNAAGILYGGQVTAGDDRVVLNPFEIKSVDDGYDVVGKGLIVNLLRTNDNEAQTQYWTGVRVQSGGTKPAGVAYQMMGAFKVGVDLTSATFSDDYAIALADNQKIYFDAEPDWHLPCPQWITSEAVTTGMLRYNLQNVYEAQTTATTGATAPVHTSGTVSDDTVNWLWIAPNQYKRHAATDSGTSMYCASGTFNLKVAGNTIIQAIGTAIVLYKGTSVTGRVNTTTTFQVADVQVMASRRTGWAATTGSVIRTDFGDDSLSDTSQALRALITDLKFHGMIGA